MESRIGLALSHLRRDGAVLGAGLAQLLAHGAAAEHANVGAGVHLRAAVRDVVQSSARYPLAQCDTTSTSTSTSRALQQQGPAIIILLLVLSLIIIRT